jgi:double-stranded uracil-DNA glycosylase
VERATVEIYEDRGEKWAREAAENTARRSAAEELGVAVAQSRVRIDVGCGAGRYTDALGEPCIGLDAARKMLGLAKVAAPHALLVQADLEALPFGRATLHGGWANMSYLHLPRKRLPGALADLQRAMVVGAPFDMQVLEGDFEGTGLKQDRIGGRFFSAWDPGRLTDVVTGAGFDVANVETEGGQGGREGVVRLRATRARTLPDTVGPGMRLLVCGLNPSTYSADAGVGFARGSNRFWRAAVASGIVDKARDARHALVANHIGMTDMVKRATRTASELSNDEYRDGTKRVTRLVEWLEPRAVCFVGLAGWRAAVDATAVAGVQDRSFGGRPAYVMPSTSGINANSQVEELTEHFRAAADLADGSSV